MFVCRPKTHSLLIVSICNCASATGPSHLVSRVPTATIKVNLCSGVMASLWFYEALTLSSVTANMAERTFGVRLIRPTCCSASDTISLRSSVEVVRFDIWWSTGKFRDLHAPSLGLLVRVSNPSGFSHLLILVILVQPSPRLSTN